jgi:hypothetical protein
MNRQQAMKKLVESMSGVLKVFHSRVGNISTPDLQMLADQCQKCYDNDGGKYPHDDVRKVHVLLNIEINKRNAVA